MTAVEPSLNQHASPEKSPQIYQNDFENESDGSATDCSDIETDCDIQESGGGKFDNICITNSNDVHLGNKTYIQGPVTIKQIMYANPGFKNIDNEVTANGSKPKFLENGFDAATLGAADEATDVTNCGKFDGHNFVVDNVNNAPSSLEKPWARFVFKKSSTILAVFLALIVMSLVALIVFLVLKENQNTNTLPYLLDDEQDKNTPIDSPVDPNTGLIATRNLRLVERKTWLAQPPVHPASLLKTPIHLVVIFHTATEGCTDQADCIFQVRQIQTYHIESYGWWDIAYNFLVGGDGAAYVGRGWLYEGANVKGYNKLVYGISFIGTFNSVLPPARQIRAAQQLIQLGVEKGYIAKDYKLLAHKQFTATQSPGETLYKEIQKWPHWEKNTSSINGLIH